MNKPEKKVVAAPRKARPTSALTHRLTRLRAPAENGFNPAQRPDGEAVADRIVKGGPVEVWIPWQLRAMFAVAPFVPRALWWRLPR